MSAEPQIHTARLIYVPDGVEESIAYMARVSNPENQDNPNHAQLIKYLIRHGHWSPFEMANVCVEIETTRAIAQQIIRHRSFAFQEFSQRYARVTKPIGLPELRAPDPKNRQKSVAGGHPQEIVDEAHTRIQAHFADATKLYDWLIGQGFARETVRDILPLATPTRLYMNGSIRSWIHYLQARCTARGTQIEHAKIADTIAALLAKKMPLIFEHLALHSDNL
jgi:thymidylate synthase (FAD)